MRHASRESFGAASGTFRSYTTGFVLAVLLTLIPFALVMGRALPPAALTLGIFAAAVVQILVHLHYFLHLDASSSQRWNLLAIVFTALIILILVGGSIWIMISLHARTMDHALDPATLSHFLN